MSFDPNKSLILWDGGQSLNMGYGFWTDSSSVGLYEKYELLKGQVIHSNLLTSNGMVLDTPYTSDIASDFLEGGTNYLNHQTSGALWINARFSFMVELMEYLDSIGYTKNVYVMNHGVGGTSLQSIIDDTDWGGGYDLFFESATRFNEIVTHEKEVNGNDSQSVNLWTQGTYDAAFFDSQVLRLNKLYERQAAIIGEEPYMFMGQITPSTADRQGMNAAFFEFQVGKPKVFIVGQDLPGGISTWQDMENNDPTGSIMASDPVTYTTLGDQTHPNWKANILLGIQRFDLFKDNYLT